MGLAVGFGRQVPGRLAPTSPRDRRAVDGAFNGPRGSPTSVCPDCPARCPATELGARARMLMVGECAVVQPAPEDRLCFPVGQLRATVGHANQPEQSSASFLYRSGHGGGIFRPGIGRLPGHLDDRPIECGVRHTHQAVLGYQDLAGQRGTSPPQPVFSWHSVIHLLANTRLPNALRTRGRRRSRLPR